MRFCDISGKKFNRLTAIKYIGEHDGIITAWLFKCDCGNEAIINGANVRHGRTKSCGCLKKETLANFKHGLSHTTTHNSWIGIFQRCENPKCAEFKYYGARGIKVCEEWRDFACFLSDMGEAPYGTSIDRIDVDGDYKKDNCRWVSHTVQVRNRRNTLMYTFNNETRSLAEWAELHNLPYKVLHHRHKIGKRDEALFAPLRKMSPRKKSAID